MLGALLSWVTVSTDYGATIAESGMAAGDGAIFLGVGIFVVALGLWVVLDHPRAAPVLLVLAGVAVVGLTALEYFSEIKGRVESTWGVEWASVGSGIYALFLGGLATALAGVMLAGKIRRAPANMVLALMTGLAVVAVLTTIVVIAFFSTVSR